jgi:hypothetical protein
MHHHTARLTRYHVKLGLGALVIEEWAFPNADA